MRPWRSLWESLLFSGAMGNILAEGMFNESELCDQRYHAVIHLVSAADGAREFYSTHINPARLEDVEQAAVVDGRIQTAWTRHPHLRISTIPPILKVKSEERLRR